MQRHTLQLRSVVGSCQAPTDRRSMSGRGKDACLCATRALSSKGMHSRQLYCTAWQKWLGCVISAHKQMLANAGVLVGGPVSTTQEERGHRSIARGVGMRGATAGQGRQDGDQTHIQSISACATLALPFGEPWAWGSCQQGAVSLQAYP